MATPVRCPLAGRCSGWEGSSAVVPTADVRSPTEEAERVGEGMFFFYHGSTK